LIDICAKFLMGLIYHVTTKEDWEKAQESGGYTAPSLASEGFIHCSEEGQVAGVLERYFSGKKDLLRLTIDTEKLTSPLKYELAPSVNEEFPHVYGQINIDAVIGVAPVQ
jgi:uncharacterized protein (DUF952 family)